MNTIIFVRKTTYTLGAFLASVLFINEAFAIDYDYSTKAITAYDHNGNIVSTQFASDVQYIEVEDYKIEPEFFTISGKGGNASFKMIPVIGVKSYMLGASGYLNWSEKDKSSAVNTFYIGETEVTNQLWKAVMGEAPSEHQGDTYPVESISWYQICGPDGFLERLNALVKNNPEIQEQMDGREFCLPNEWEWEYAANGGSLNEDYIYSGSNELSDVGWFTTNATDGKTHEVAKLAPNSLGIYDMSGNVWEWCAGKSYRKDDNSPVDYTLRALRGGSFISSSNYCTSYRRSYGDMHSIKNNAGFRLALKEKVLEPEIFTMTDADGNNLAFKMIPVIGTSSFKFENSNINWPEADRYSNVNTFFMGETEVTNALWKAVMGSIPSQTSGNNYPVESVSWNDICGVGGFIDKLNEVLKDQLNGRKFGLPTEWEWEYAANGGIHKSGYNYSGSNTLSQVGWYDDGTASNKAVHEVAKKAPNALGLYDMSGNVWEWCAGTSYRSEDDTVNDTKSRTVRGGSYTSAQYFCRIQTRSYNNVDLGKPTCGLRLVLK